MAENELLKKEYSSLTGEYLKFKTVRAVVMLTIVITLFNATNFFNSSNIVLKIEKIRELSDLTKVPPQVDDVILSNFFFEREENSKIGDTAFMASSPEKLPAQQKKEQNERLQEQGKLLEELLADSRKAFEIKLSFLAESTIDLRLGIFILPFIFIISAIYSFILRTKINLLVGILQEEPGAGGSNSDLLLAGKINSFIQQPFVFLSSFYQLVELVLVVLYLSSVYTFLNNVLASIIVELSCLYFLVLYYALVYAAKTYREIICVYTQKQPDVPVIIKVCNYFQQLIKKVIQRISFRLSLRLSTVLFLATLFMTMSSRTCSDGRNIPENQIKGYELLIFFGNRIWQFAEGGKIINYFYQFLYVLSMVTSLWCSLMLFGKLLFPIKLIHRAKFVQANLQINSVILQVFSLYFASQFDRAFGSINISQFFIFTLFVLLGWFNYNRWNAGYTASDGHLYRVNKNLLILAFPLILLGILNVIYFYSWVPGWTLFYPGLCFLQLGLYGYAKWLQALNSH